MGSVLLWQWFDCASAIFRTSLLITSFQIFVYTLPSTCLDSMIEFHNNRIPILLNILFVSREILLLLLLHVHVNQCSPVKLQLTIANWQTYNKLDSDVTPFSPTICTCLTEQICHDENQAKSKSHRPFLWYSELPAPFTLTASVRTRVFVFRYITKTCITHCNQ